MERRFRVTHTAIGWWRSIDVRTIVDSVNMPDPIGSVLVASCGHYGQRAAKMGPDRKCQIRLPASVSILFFQKTHGSYCTKPTRIWSEWPGQGLAKRIWSGSKLVCRNHPARVWQDATGPLPVFHFQTRFRSSTDVPDNTVWNQPGSDLVLADCVRFWPSVSGPEASRCARIIRPASGQCFLVDLDRMRIGTGMFTGELQT